MPESILNVAKRADAFFMQKSPIHETMRRLAAALREMQIPFAGAMAANAYGHKRTTGDINILIRREDLQRFKDRHSGRGWTDRFEGSQSFRDAVTNVNVDVLMVGEYPGDGLPKAVVFPEPETVAEHIHDEQIPYVSLKTLLELKLASGMTAAHRLQDLADVIQLVKVNGLSAEYADTLNPFVREKYRELWQAAQIEEEY